MRMQRCGFTLIELLVVIAVIALLIGILLPALGGARSSGRATIDLANLRSLGQGLEMYTQNEGSFPALRLPRGETHLSTGRPRARWHWGIGDYIGQPYAPRGQEEYDDFINGRNPIPRIDNRVFMDPSHTLDDYLGSDGKIQALRNGSYGYNYHYLGNSREEGPDGRAANYPVRHSRIFFPVKTVAFGDTNGNQYRRRDMNIREHGYTMDPPRLDTKHNNAQTFAQEDGKSPADARHLGKANITFVDGHGEPMTLEELGYIVVDKAQNIVADDAGSNAMWNGMGEDKEATEG